MTKLGTVYLIKTMTYKRMNYPAENCRE